MDKNRVLIAVSLLVSFVLAGCAAKQEYAPSEPLCLANVEKAELMQAGEDVLTRLQFVVEKYDVESGLIRTMPLRGGQFFEFWRQDNVGAGNNAEANFHSVQRTAELSFQQDASGVCVKCDVFVQRLSIPEREFLSKAETAGTFTASSVARQTLRLRGEPEEMAWIELGPEHGLERRVLERIEKTINKGKDNK